MRLHDAWISRLMPRISPQPQLGRSKSATMTSEHGSHPMAWVQDTHRWAAIHVPAAGLNGSVVYVISVPGGTTWARSLPITAAQRHAEQHRDAAQDRTGDQRHGAHPYGPPEPVHSGRRRVISGVPAR